MSVDDTRDFRSLTTGLQQRADQSDTPVAANLRSIQEQFDAIAAGDLARVIARADAQVTLEMFVPPELPFILHASGADAFREAVHQNFGTIVRPEMAPAPAPVSSPAASEPAGGPSAQPN